MYLVFNVFYFYSGVGQKDSGVGRAHLAPPLCYALGGSVDFLARKEKELVPLRFASALSTGLKWFWWGAS
jgi:hypothetical protein